MDGFIRVHGGEFRHLLLHAFFKKYKLKKYEAQNAEILRNI